MLSGVYNAETVRIQPLEGEYNGVDLIGGVGTDQTAWDILGLDKDGKLVMFSMIGRPELADLDGNGTKELVASFEGAHLNFPNLEIMRINNGRIESTEVINANAGVEDQQYARLLNKTGSYLIEIGKVRDEVSGRQYKYDDGRLMAVHESAQLSNGNAYTNSEFNITSVAFTNVPTAAKVKREGFTDTSAIAMVLKARAKGQGSKPDIDFPSNSGQTKIIEGTIGGKSGEIKLELSTFAEEKNDGTFVVTLTKDWNLKVGNKEVISYWEYQVDLKAGVKLLKIDDNDKLVAIIK